MPILALFNGLFVAASVAVFTGVILSLVVGLMLASRKLQPQGAVTIDINDGKKKLEVQPGSTLLSALSSSSVYLPSACGGGGTCAMCKCQVLEGGGSILPTETGHISKQEAKEGMRLGCQVKVKNDMKIHVHDEVLEIQKFEGTVRSNHNVATFIKEFIVDLPAGVDLNFKAGGYIQIDIPEYDLQFKDFQIEERFRDAWDRFKLWDLHAKNSEPCFRAYSMANHPAEGNCVMLNVRIATPPPNLQVPPGIASSYIFSLKPGDKVWISGPFGEFFAKDTDKEMVYIGGGAGMAPLRSHTLDLLTTKNSKRKISYWYGARSLREMFYEEDFRKLEKEHPNFQFNIALSEPQPEDNWTGYTGFIHQVLLDNYLSKHEDPTEIEYYLCGPPPMIAAVQKMLYDLGVEKEQIAFDDFG
ncbi:MAG: NADH:ubiquinone reductase (Na(+)-transporting) subunit F [Verrucomicrobia bacterium]|nr:NADH:ubiquinone reductase (Na(+)-transporting) subunit F [Kiritimatiellia bacterium]MCP5488297.1 NADH:ubiquinone reductase (Na(+)-transporting) subunit F [Verrucomicrobiota bacterium]